MRYRPAVMGDEQAEKGAETGNPDWLSAILAVDADLRTLPNLTQAQAAKRRGLHATTVSRGLKILPLLNDATRRLILERSVGRGGLAQGTAERLTPLGDPGKVQTAVEYILNTGIHPRRVEALVAWMKTGGVPETFPRWESASEPEASEALPPDPPNPPTEKPPRRYVNLSEPEEEPDSPQPPVDPEPPLVTRRASKRDTSPPPGHPIRRVLLWTSAIIMVAAIALEAGYQLGRKKTPPPGQSSETVPVPTPAVAEAMAGKPITTPPTPVPPISQTPGVLAAQQKATLTAEMAAVRSAQPKPATSPASKGPVATPTWPGGHPAAWRIGRVVAGLEDPAVRAHLTTGCLKCNFVFLAFRSQFPAEAQVALGVNPPGPLVAPISDAVLVEHKPDGSYSVDDSCERAAFQQHVELSGSSYQIDIYGPLSSVKRICSTYFVRCRVSKTPEGKRLAEVKEIAERRVRELFTSPPAARLTGPLSNWFPPDSSTPTNDAPWPYVLIVSALEK